MWKKLRVVISGRGVRGDKSSFKGLIHEGKEKGIVERI